MTFIIQWIDTIWLVLAFVIPHKKQRWLAVGFVLGCMLMMRMQVELMISIDYPRGLVGFMHSHVFFRGLAVYSFFYTGYMLLAHYSKNSRPIIFTAASISIFFMALFTSTLIMVL